MKKQISCKWYTYQDVDGLYVVRLTFVNLDNGLKLYQSFTGKTRKEAQVKAQRFETAVYNRANMIYK